jgi:hypothetical protein
VHSLGRKVGAVAALSAIRAASNFAGLCRHPIIARAFKAAVEHYPMAAGAAGERAAWVVANFSHYDLAAAVFRGSVCWNQALTEVGLLIAKHRGPPFF